VLRQRYAATAGSHFLFFIFFILFYFFLNFILFILFIYIFLKHVAAYDWLFITAGGSLIVAGGSLIIIAGGSLVVAGGSLIAAGGSLNPKKEQHPGRAIRPIRLTLSPCCDEHLGRGGLTAL
jgi:hypothetical protein